MKCDTCRWFDSESRRASWSEQDGVCRLLPPQPVVTEVAVSFGFPEVRCDDWCSRYEQAQPAVPVPEAGRTELTFHQAGAVVEATLRQHAERRDFRGESEGCRCGARGPYLRHLASEVAVSLGFLR